MSQVSEEEDLRDGQIRSGAVSEARSSDQHRHSDEKIQPETKNGVASQDESASGEISQSPSVANASNVESRADSEASDAEYDPESVNPSPEPEYKTTVLPAQDAPTSPSDDEYDPELSIQPPEHSTAAVEASGGAVGPEPSHLPNKPMLPPKPVNSTAPKDPQTQLKEAYEAIMQSDLVKRPEFKQMTQEQQMALIDQQLKEKGISLPSLGGETKDDMNYDQVYSFNKPHDSGPQIPLVPRNKHCRRPNLSLPMSPEEEKAYQKYLENEEKFSNRRLLDQLPEGSRLFVGNLSTNTVSKNALFRICRMYGEVVHINLKGGYGFVQYTNAESCAACIKGETDVPLHGRFMRWDASSSSKRTDHEQVRFREREAEEDISVNDEESNPIDCQIIVTADSAPDLVKNTTNSFESAGLSFEVSDIGDQDLSEVIPDIAYSGVLGACIVREEKVDLQTFEETEEGGVKFDEYLDLVPSVAIDLIKRMKPSSPKTSPKLPQAPAPQKEDMSRTSPSTEYDNRPRKQRKKERAKDPRPTHQNRGQYNQSSANDNFQYPSSGDVPRGEPLPPRFQPPAPTPFPAQSGYGSQVNAYQSPAPFPPHAQYSGSQQGQYPNAYGQNVYPQIASVPQPMSNTDALKILSNLDPATLQSLITLVQQQAAGVQQQTSVAQQYSPSANGSFYGQQHAVSYPPPPQPIQQPTQLNSLLTQLQAPQHPSSSQTHQHSQQPGQSSTLMDMLARLSKQ